MSDKPQLPLGMVMSILSEMRMARIKVQLNGEKDPGQLDKANTCATIIDRVTGSEVTYSYDELTAMQNEWLEALEGNPKVRSIILTMLLGAIAQHGGILEQVLRKDRH